MTSIAKYSLIAVFLLITFGCDRNNNNLPEASFKCVNGVAKDTYTCNNIDLFSNIPTYLLFNLTEQEYNALSESEQGALRLNDIWGWTDPSTNIEYALVGLIDGVSFVDISDPNNPVVIGKLEESNLNAKFKIAEPDLAYPACTIGIGDTEAAKNLTQGSIWRDMKVFDNHMFVVSDNQAHGMQVFDLTKLRSYSGEFLTFSHDALYDQFANAHNIVINEETGYAYAAGVTTSEICGSRQETGLHIVDVNNPKQPSFAGCFFDPDTEINNGLSVGVGYVHDAQCIVYDGPDTEHSGKEICLSSAEGAVVISDVTDKLNPSTIGFSGQTQMQYSHQGWVTQDHAYFLMNDELDEGNLGRNTRTYIWDIRDLNNPVFVDYYTHSTSSIDHNLYVKNNIVYQSNYTSGLRALKIGNLSNAELTPIGHFDTQPFTDATSYTGTWSSYPFFDSGVIIASDIQDGLFILRPDF